MISWIVTFKDGSTIIVHKELIVNICDYIITNSNHDIEDVIAINKIIEA